MRRRGLWAACVVLLAGMGVLAVGAGFAKDDNTVAKCSEATLHGTYLYADHGFDITGDDQVPIAEAGYQVFNGNGKVKGVFSSNFNGKITRKESFSATYTVEANCTGTVTYSPTEAIDVFIAPDGSVFTAVQIKPSNKLVRGTTHLGVELQATAKRVGN